MSIIDMNATWIGMGIEDAKANLTPRLLHFGAEVSF